MKKIVLTKNSFEKKTLFESNSADVEVSELNPMMDLEEGQTAIIKVRQLKLDEFLSIKSNLNDYFRNIVDGIISAAINKKEVEDEATYRWNKMSPDTKYNMDIVSAGIVEPKLNRSDLLFLKDHFPNIIIRLSAKIIELTNGGATLKKNS